MVLDRVDRVDITDSVRIATDSDDSEEISDDGQDDGDQIDINQNDNGHIFQILQVLKFPANKNLFLIRTKPCE